MVIVLDANKREVFGRKLKSLRREGIIPANVYGKMASSSAIQVDLKNFLKTYEEAGETGLVTLKVGSDSRPVLIHNVQRNPVTSSPLHVDFLQVDLKAKVTVMVPLEFVGESPAEANETGIVVRQLNEVEVEALPAELPEMIEVDLSKLENVDDSVKVGELGVDTTKVEVKSDFEQIVVLVAEPAKEEEPLPVEEAEEGTTGEAENIDGVETQNDDSNGAAEGEEETK